MRTIGFLNWLASFRPLPSSARYQEWPRAALGAASGIFIAALVCQQLFGTQVMLCLIGPLGASAVLLFAVSSGALAQPWSLFGSYLIATVVATATGQLLDHSLASACLAAGLSLMLMFPLRCLHPPGGAIALCVVLAGPTLSEMGWAVLLPVLSNAGCLLLCALLYNNLSGIRYPREQTSLTVSQHANNLLPASRASIQASDLNKALEDFGAFVDVTRDDLQQLIQQTEMHALRRRTGTVCAGQVMSRKWCSATPQTGLEQACELFTQHAVQVLPVLEGGKLVGIVTLHDVMQRLRQRYRPRLLGGRGEVRLAALMSASVCSVQVHTDVFEVIGLLSSQGLHALPVLEEGCLIGMITPVDLIAALPRALVMQSA